MIGIDISADNWPCCVAPADFASQKTLSCHPGGNECSICKGFSSLGCSLIFSGDPQYAWYNGVYPKNMNIGDRNSNAERQINQQYKSRLSIPNVKGVIFNGDLTDGGWQYDVSTF